jgi:PKD repeat protein
MLISNPDGNITWEVTNTLQNVAANNGTNAARVRNYDYNAAGQRDFLFTPSLDLRSYNTVNVSFQHCYRLFTGYPTDTLRVWVFSNCDSLWTLIQTFIGNPAAGLATGDTLTINHRTNPNQTSNWCYATGGLPCQNLNISAFAGQPNVRVVFENATAYGNDLYLDNINITGTVTAPPTASFTKSSATVCAGGTITFTDNSTGSVTTRSWTFNGGSPASGSGTTHTVTFNTPGTYNITLQVTGPGGSNSTTQQVTVYANPTLNATPSNAICTANNGSVTLAGSGGQTPYQYSLNGGTLQSSGSFSNLAPGSYTALVQDNRGCQGTATFNIGVTNTTLTVGGTPTSTSCHGGSNGQIVASASGGTAPYQYSLDAGPYQSNATFTGLSAGSYAVNARDANGCTGTTTVVVGEPSALSLNATPTASTSCATPNGQVVLTGSGGTGTLQYSLDGSSFQSSGTFTNLAPGTYTATVRDANNCTTTSSFAIGSPATFTPNASASHVTCNGLANGGLTVSVTPAGTYQYSLDGTNFQPSNQFTGLAPGNYTVTVRDGNSCTATATATVTEPAALTMSLGATNATGPATADGSVDASVAGGTPAYSYSWSNGATTEDLANVAPGVYILNVTDANGCQLADTATVGFTVGRPDAQEAFFQLFPNPTHGDVTVRGPFSAQSPAIAVVYDAAGREVARLQLAQPEQTLNLSLATGLYEVAITHTGKTARVKLIVR